MMIALNGYICEHKGLEILWMNPGMGLRMSISNLTTRSPGTRSSSTSWRWKNGCQSMLDPQTH